MEERECGMRAEALNDRKHADNGPIGHRVVHDETRYARLLRSACGALIILDALSTTRTRSSLSMKVIVDFLQRQVDDFLPSASSAAIKD